MVSDICISWSGGKDSCLAYNRLLSNGAYRIGGLLTAYNTASGCVNLHNVPIELIRLQAESIGIPLYEIPLTGNASNNEYEAAHTAAFEMLKSRGMDTMAYGDIFLEHIREYRDKLAEKTGMNFIYPLWKDMPSELAMEFINRGFHAIITAINSEIMEDFMLGKEYDEEFISLLPKGLDICGENGEFHSFVYDGPFFSRRVNFKKGDITETDYRPIVEMKMKFLNIFS